MSYNEKLTMRVREKLSHVPNVEEKKMFRGVVFMVEGKMCITVGDTRIMCRIDPDLHEEMIKKENTQPVIMRGRNYKGYIYIEEAGIESKKDFDYWVSLALNFNPRARAGKNRNKKAGGNSAQ